VRVVGLRERLTDLWAENTRRMYAGGRPNARAKRLNALWARLARRGVRVGGVSTLVVVGRSSGTPIDVPIIPVRVDGRVYVGSMLGPTANWVRNTQAAGGHAMLHDGRHHDRVILVETPVEGRARLIQAFLDAAPGARPHVPVDRSQPLDQIQRYADQIPVFEVTYPDR